MNRTVLQIWVVATLLSAGVLGWAGLAAAGAGRESAEARRELALVTHQATELVRLRVAGATDVSERPEGGLANRVAAAMSRAGLASSILQGLSPEARSSVTDQGGVKLVRQRATLALQGLSLPQLGKFFDAWTATEPDWVITGIDLSPVIGQGTASIGTDLPLRAVLTIEGLFKASVRDQVPGASP